MPNRPPPAARPPGPSAGPSAGASAGASAGSGFDLPRVPGAAAGDSDHPAARPAPTGLAGLPLHRAAVRPTALSRDVKALLDADPDLPGVVVVDGPGAGGRLLGVLSRATFLEHLGRPFGVEVFLGRPVTVLLGKATDPPLVLSGAATVPEAADAVLARGRGEFHEPVAVRFKQPAADGRPAGPTYRLLDVPDLFLAQSRLLAEANARVRRRQRAAELARAEAERATAQAQRAKAAAESANASKTEFLANMSHEIRTPLTAILGFAENLRDLLGSEDHGDRGGGREADGAAHAAGAIHRNGQHLLGVINDLLDLSKIEAGRLELEPLPTDPARLAADVLDSLRVKAEAKRLPLELTFDTPLPAEVVTDPTRLRQVLLNLVGNAVKFTAAGRVRLRTRYADDRLSFAVEDTGVGIDPATAARLFEPFRQADGGTARKFGGTGLGLTICRKICRSMGGDVTATGVPGGGSTFTATVAAPPVDGADWHDDPADALTRAAGARTARAAALPPLTRGGRPLRLLLAEDAPDNRLLIGGFLRGRGATVELAADGRRAVDAAFAAEAAGEPFDLILMDMQMPVLDGYGAARELRAGGYGRPICALTANVLAEDRGRTAAAGCDGFAAKPIDRPALVAAVRDLTGADDAPPPPPPPAAPVPPGDPPARGGPAVYDAAVYDAAVAADRADGDGDLAAALREVFRAEAPDLLAGLADADPAAAERAAHTLKSAADNVGAARLHAAAATLERALERGDGDRGALLERVRTECAALLAALPG